MTTTTAEAEEADRTSQHGTDQHESAPREIDGGEQMSADPLGSLLLAKPLYLEDGGTWHGGGYHFGPGELPTERWADDMTAWWQAHPPPKRGAFRIDLKVPACPDVAACKSRFFTKVVLTPATHAGPIVVNYRLNFPYDDKWQRVHAPRLRPGRRFEFGGR